MCRALIAEPLMAVGDNIDRLTGMLRFSVTGAGSVRDQALYSAKLALISAILYVIAAIAM